MVTGKELKRVRQARRMTLAEAGAAMNVGARTVGRWESSAELPKSAVPVVEQFLGVASPEGVGPTLRGATKWELLAELARRLESGPAETHPHSSLEDMIEEGEVPEEILNDPAYRPGHKDRPAL